MKRQSWLHKPQWLVIFIVIIFASTYIAALLLSRELRREPFIQRLTGPIFTLGAAVVLFAGVPSFASVKFPLLQKGMITLAGAAAFFYVALPPIMKALFPAELTITGYIYYQKKDDTEQGLKPVQGVVVQIAQTGQQSEPTNEQGRFIIDHVSFQPTELKAYFGGIAYPIDLEKYPNGNYPVIPRDPPPKQTEWKYLDPNKWHGGVDQGYCLKVNKQRDCLAARSNYQSIKFLVLDEKEFPMITSYKKLFLRISLQGSADIIDAQKVVPPPGAGREVSENNRCQARQWWVPVMQDKQQIKIAVCLGVKSQEFSLTDLQTTYMFSEN